MRIIASTCCMYEQQRKWRWTRVKVWASVQSLQASDSWCDLPMNSGRESKRVLELVPCFPPTNSCTCRCMCSFQKHSASKCWGRTRNYAAQLLMCGKCCVCSSLHASPDADRSGRVEDASEISLYTAAVTRCGFGGSRKLVSVLEDYNPHIKLFFSTVERARSHLY